MSHVSSQNVSPSLLSLSVAAANASPMSHPDPLRATTTRHRRLSSLGRSRRRLSDARDAATRPVSSLQTAAASLAALSLASPTLSHPSVNAQPIRDLSPSPGKRAVFSCESCSKVYRHPSCLIKHRWEHTPQWRQASKFVLSKHQQVQLLEAAAILSHLSPSSASLPEDRSLWPSFLSGGLVPPPANKSPHLISSSVPGPRLHDYPIARSVTQVPLGVPTAEDDALNLLALREASCVRTRGHSFSHAHSHSLSSLSHAKERERRRSNAFEYAYTTPTGWSLPRSSLRSQSGSRSRSESQSASESRSDGEYADDDVRVGFDDMDDDPVERKRMDQWDGMEMEMEMG